MNSFRENLLSICRSFLLIGILLASHLLKLIKVNIIELNFVTHLCPTVRSIEVLMDDGRIDTIYASILVPYRVFSKVFGSLVYFFGLSLDFFEKFLDRSCVTLCSVILCDFN